MKVLSEITHAAFHIIRMKIAKRMGNADMYYDSAGAFFGQFDRYEQEGKRISR